MPFEPTKVVIIHCNDSGISLADILSIVFGVLNLAFVYVNLRAILNIFNHQKEKEKRDDKIGWLKELVIIPNIQKIYTHFENIETIALKIKAASPLDSEKQKIDREIKAELSNFRRSCISLFHSINASLGDSIQKISDDFLENIQKEIYYSTVDLSDEKNFNEHVAELILKYKRDILSGINKYEGE